MQHGAAQLRAGAWPLWVALLLALLLALPALAQDDDVLELDVLAIEVEALPEEEEAPVEEDVLPEADASADPEPEPAHDPPTEAPLPADDPAVVHVITREDIERRGAESVDRVLEGEAGFVVSDTFAGKEVSYQGLPGKFSAVTVDGQRLPGHILERVDFGQLGTGGLERVEVVRGPQAAAYGPHSAGVVVNMVPRRAQRREGELSLGVGSLGYNRQSVWLGEADGGSDWTFSLDRTLRESYDLNALFPDTDGDSYRRWNVALDYGRRFGGAGVPACEGGHGGPPHQSCGGCSAAPLRDEFRLRLEHFAEDTAGQGFSPPNLTRALVGETRRSRLVGSYRWELDSGALELSHNYGVYRHDIERFFPDFPETLQETGFTEELHDTRLSWDSGRWQVGAEHMLDRLESDRISAGAADATQLGAYVVWNSGELDACRAVRYDLALRLDHHDEFGARLTPKAGATWRLDERSTLALGAGMGYRAPSLRERNYEFASPFGYTVVGNPELVPELALSLSADYEWRGPRSRVSFGAFRHEVDNLISFSQIQQVPQVFRTENVGAALSSGMQLGLERSWDRVTLGYDGVWLAQSEDSELSTRLANAPRLDHRLHALYDAGCWDAGATWRSIGSRFLDRENTSLAPGYATLDVLLGLESGPGRWRLAALNALDVSDGRFGPEPGRELRLEYTLGF